MSTIAKLTGDNFDRMVQRGAFLDLEPLKVELIYGELRFMHPAGPVHEGEIEHLRWLFESACSWEGGPRAARVNGALLTLSAALV